MFFVICDYFFLSGRLICIEHYVSDLSQLLLTRLQQSSHAFLYAEHKCSLWSRLDKHHCMAQASFAHSFCSGGASFFWASRLPFPVYTNVIRMGMRVILLIAYLFTLKWMNESMNRSIVRCFSLCHFSTWLVKVKTPSTISHQLDAFFDVLKIHGYTYLVTRRGKHVGGTPPCFMKIDTTVLTHNE